MSEYVSIDFDVNTVSKAELEGHQRTLAYWKQRRFPKAKPVPVPVPPAETLILDEPWQSLANWGQGMNGDAGATLVPGGVSLWIRNARSIPNGTGARLFHLVPPSKKWVSLPDGVRTIRYPLTIPDLFTVDQGAGMFMSMGIQFKDQTDNNALWTVNVESVDGQLVAWLWHREAGVFHAAIFPAYAIGRPNDCALRVNVAPDTSGWLEFTLAGQTIRAEGVRTRGSDTDDNGWGLVVYSNATDQARVTFGRLTVG